MKSTFPKTHRPFLTLPPYKDLAIKIVSYLICKNMGVVSNILHNKVQLQNGQIIKRLVM